MNNIKIPNTSSHMVQQRTSESIQLERLQNERLLELGIDPYEYDNEREFTEEEQELINEAMRLVVLEKEIPKELAEKVKEITKAVNE